MRLPSIFRLRLRSLFRRRRVEEELDEEFRYHLERQIDENIAAGMSREDARHSALRTVASLEQRKEECRDTRGWNLLDHILSDVRFAARQLRHSPEFAVTAMLMLALGMCANIAIFAFVDAALIKPLPYAKPDRLLGIFERIDPWCPQCNLSWPDYLDWKKENSTLASLDVFQPHGYTLTNHSGAVPVHAARISDGFFRTLGVVPTLGRDFFKGEDGPGAARTVILSHAAWQRQFGGQATVLGKTVVLDRIPRTIVGVLPENFHFALAVLGAHEEQARHIDDGNQQKQSRASHQNEQNRFYVAGNHVAKRNDVGALIAIRVRMNRFEPFRDRDQVS